MARRPRSRGASFSARPLPRGARRACADWVRNRRSFAGHAPRTGASAREVCGDPRPPVDFAVVLLLTRQFRPPLTQPIFSGLTQLTGGLARLRRRRGRCCALASRRPTSNPLHRGVCTVGFPAGVELSQNGCGWGCTWPEARCIRHRIARHRPCPPIGALPPGASSGAAAEVEGWDYPRLRVARTPSESNQRCS